MAHAVGDYAAEQFLKVDQIILKNTPWLRIYIHKASEVAMFWLQYRTLSVSILVALELGERIPRKFWQRICQTFCPSLGRFTEVVSLFPICLADNNIAINHVIHNIYMFLDIEKKLPANL